MSRYRDTRPGTPLSSLTRRYMERMEREAFTREFNEREAREPRFSEDRFDPWHGRSLSAPEVQINEREVGAR